MKGLNEHEDERCHWCRKIYIRDRNFLFVKKLQRQQWCQWGKENDTEREREREETTSAYNGLGKGYGKIRILSKKREFERD